MSDTTTPSGWYMYHGGPGHGGNATAYSTLNSANVGSSQFQLLNSIQTNGSILSVPTVSNGFIYVGLANSHEAPGSIGGTMQKYNISSAAGGDNTPVLEFTWAIDVNDRDSHGFTGMGCTPTVINGHVYFIGFDAKLYCLKDADFTLVWKTDLRYADPAHNQPITNTVGMNEGNPPAAGWSSPLVISTGPNTSSVYVGVGEGENPYLFSFIYCLDGNTGNVEWIYCTCQYNQGLPNPVNQLPSQVCPSPAPAPYSLYSGPVITQGCSVWSAIAYDSTTGLIYASTGQPASPTNPSIDRGLPSVGWSSGILALNAATGNFVAFQQMPLTTSYRPTDYDVDIGSAPTLYDMPVSGTGQTQRVVAVGCKNGGFMVCDAKTLQLINSVSLLPRYNDGTQIPEIDPHPDPNATGMNPPTSNEVSNVNWNENYYGPFNTAAVDPTTGTLFIGIGGPNYHAQAPGIDYNTTPFMKAIKWDTLRDAWPMDNGNPPKYSQVGASMYTTAAESGISSPAVVNDVVFAATTKVALYAFNVKDGTLLWSDVMGSPTLGFNGGYGYCLGAAIWGQYVVAGCLIQGLSGGLLNIYGLKTS